jgi:4-hydroxy-tetrahydrodipicolinate reductase
VLTIRHDATGRDTYVPGVVLAIQAVQQRVGLVRGLDTIMGLDASEASA